MGRHTDPTTVTRRAAVLTLTASALLVAAGIAVLVGSGGMGRPGRPPAPTASVPPSSPVPEPRRTPPADPATGVPTTTHRTPHVVITAVDARATPTPRTSGSPAPAPASSPSRPTAPRTENVGPVSGGLAEQVLTLVNIERARAGCSPVIRNAILQRAAQAHSADLAAPDRQSHDSPGGESFVARIRAAGYHGGPVGENVAAGQSTANAVMKAWMSSPAHRANIIDCRFSALGVGRASGGASGPYWTQDFGG
jgi:uncharacterized protein YkwD